jgi:DNA-directed RNA polymerase subunit RPC12/RpoP
MRRIEYVCQTCLVPFTVWWEGKEHPPRINCPVCRGESVKMEGEYEYRFTVRRGREKK